MFDVIHLLTGDSAPPPLLDEMVDLYVRKRKYDLEKTMWYAHYRSLSEARDLIDAYEALPDAARLNFLLSPSTYELVHAAKHLPDESIHQLILYARDQLSFVQGKPPSGHREGDQEIWSPLGGDALTRKGDEWELRSSPRLDSLVVVDFDSPFARALLTSPLMSRPPEDFCEAERESITAKLDCALQYVDSVVPPFGRMIRNYTRAVRIRKCESFNDLQSEHVTNTIGEIRLMNVHRDAFSVIKCAESLVHESVHNLLSTYEYLHIPFVLSHDDRKYRPVSSWSGNPIPVGSYSHAVLVWFTLYNMSLRELEQPGLTAEQKVKIQRRRNKYAAGFMSPTRLSEHIGGLAFFNRGFLSIVDRLQEIVKGLEAGRTSKLLEAGVAA